MERISRSSALNLFKRHGKARIQEMVGSAPNLYITGLYSLLGDDEKDCILHYLIKGMNKASRTTLSSRWRWLGAADAQTATGVQYSNKGSTNDQKHREVIVQQSKTALAFLSIPSLQEAEATISQTCLSKVTLLSKDSNVSTVVQITTGKRDIRMWRHFRSGPADNHSHSLSWINLHVPPEIPLADRIQIVTKATSKNFSVRTRINCRNKSYVISVANETIHNNIKNGTENTTLWNPKATGWKLLLAPSKQTRCVRLLRENYSGWKRQSHQHRPI